MRLFTFGLCFVASTATACPDGSETLVSCALEGGRKYLQTCLVGDQVTYSFGRTGRTPDLQLSRHVTEVFLYPWPAASRTIWESVTFENAGVSYRVYYAQERDPRTPEVSGGVYVERGEDVLAELTCDPGSVETAGYPLPLFDAKEAAGQIFDRNSYTWE